ncbi:hypothetical protein ABBQ32_002099 [Trebouxia sp. C0010 RCD-2024]
MLQDSVLSDSDAEDEGAPGTVQQQLTTPAARAALTAYSIALSPNRRKPRPKGSQQLDAATCSSEPCKDDTACSNGSHEKASQRPPRGSGQPRRGNRCVISRHKSDCGPRMQLDQQSPSKVGVSAVRDPAKDIARAAARSRPGGVSSTSDMSLVPRLRMTPDSSGFKVSSLHAAAGVPSGPMQLSALEPVEFAIDRPPWRRALSQRQQDGLDNQDSQHCNVEAPVDVNAMMPSTPAVITPILTTAQLDADSMEAACAVADYPWHYNFIPAARRAPTGTAGFASTSSLEQERRRSLLFDAHKKQSLVNALAKAPMSGDSIPMLQPTSSAISSSRMMGYSRSLSGVARPQGLPSLEINGHPVSLSGDRPSSAQRATIG